MKRIGSAIILAAVGIAVLPPVADAGWSRARLMSAIGIEQALSAGAPTGGANYVGLPDLSADGRYLVFDSSARNLLAGEGPDVQATAEGGVFRRPVDGGALEVVALAPAPATAPRTLTPVSVSADGRYVAFHTPRALAAADTDTSVDVYVRDMSVARTDPAAYRLVSDGLDGAVELAGDSALSGDATRVLLRSIGAIDTLVVRHVVTGASTVISDDVPKGSPAPVLSADGSTVVWRDADPVSRVVPGAFLPGEVPIGTELNPDASWVNTTELLWQRVGDPVARRIATAGDAEDPGCPGGTALVVNTSPLIDGIRSPCDGVFRYGPSSDLTGSFGAVALSESGRMVAFTTDAPRRLGNTQSDLLVRDMGAAGGRKATTTELTRFTGAGTIDGVSMSTGGTSVVFASKSDRSTLASPTFTSAAIGPGAANVYVADLTTNVVERITRAFDGTLANGDSSFPVLSADGARVAFRSSATNLLFGDANAISDVFVADRFDDTQPPLTETGTGIGAASSEVRATDVRATWRLSATVSRGGSVLYVDARVPGAGQLTAIARALKPAKGRRAPSVIARTQGRAAGAGLRRLRLRLPAR
ncbi:MAG: hypothetical protein ACEQSX_17655, partial [Baekduiaceae bacterium]